MRTNALFGAAVLLMTATALSARADTMYLQTDQNLTAGGNIAGTNGNGTAVSKTKDAGGPPYVYDFGDASTTPGNFTGDLHLQTRKLYTTGGNSLSFTLEMGGYGLHGGSEVTSLSTAASANPSGSIVINNVGVVDIGYVTTVNSYAVRGNAGSVTVGAISARAGTVRIDGIATYNSSGDNCGDVTIYGTGAVSIATASGTPGDIFAQNAGWGKPGSIKIDHNGAFVAHDIDAYSGDPGSGAIVGKSLELNGDGPGDGASGDLDAHSIRVYREAGTWGSDGTPVTISGYTAARLSGDLLTYNQSSGGHNSMSGGNVNITNITGDIRIDGTIDARSAVATDGYLNLQCGGTITVNDLNLTNLQYAAFSPGSAGYITGVIIGADGLAATPTTVGTIRTPPGKTVYYDPEINADLLEQTVALNKPDGTAGGGYLAPETATGTLILIR